MSDVEDASHCLFSFLTQGYRLILHVQGSQKAINKANISQI